ncbi:hypothetical protein SCHPADRAFT_948469 [Schizopora paradoxa]|uniref:CCHC-type domain-containing protein n=1 Tax=Schizopora paradoxa TaxID=27342 RepID=A0A0H2QVT4_9AGAM|nr:hypothetical protein SCHPADRAFT_948469 [Schizopora paradoxa]
MVNPHKPVREPWAITDIINAAEYILDRQKAERTVEISSGSEDESEDFDTSDESDSESESESESDSGGESEPVKKRRHSKEVKVTRTRIPPPSKKHREHFQKLEEEGTTAAQKDEVENLIKQMGALSLDDPAYGFYYYRACRLDPKVESFIPRPQPQRREAPPRASYGGSSPGLPRSNPGVTCYGCGEQGHRINNCMKIADYIAKGFIARDNMGRLMMKDGSRIPRMDGEPFANAIERNIPRTNLVTMAAKVRMPEYMRTKDSVNSEKPFRESICTTS